MARDLFGLNFSSQDLVYPTYGSPMHTLMLSPSPQMVAFFHPAPDVHTPSPIVNFTGTPPCSQISPLAVAAFTPSPVYYTAPQFTPVTPMQLADGSFASSSTGVSYSGLVDTPFSLTGMDSASLGLEDLLDIIDNSELEMEDPLGLNGSGGQTSSKSGASGNAKAEVNTHTSTAVTALQSGATRQGTEEDRDFVYEDKSPGGVSTIFETGTGHQATDEPESSQVSSICESLQVNCSSPPDFLAMLEELNNQPLDSTNDDAFVNLNGTSYTVDLLSEHGNNLRMNTWATATTSELGEPSHEFHLRNTVGRLTSRETLNRPTNSELIAPMQVEGTSSHDVNLLTSAEVEVVALEDAAAAVDDLPDLTGDLALFGL